MDTFDVAVLGGGLSGLAAARKLQAAGKRVVVLEARDRVGGRSYTVALAGAPVDLGGQWIGPTQDRVIGLAKELGVATFPQHHAGTRVLELDGRVKEYRGTIPKVPILHSIEAGITLARFELMSRRVSAEEPWTSAQWDAGSLGDWVDAHVRTSSAKKLLAMATEMICGCEPRDISLLYFLFYLRAGGGFARLAEVRNGAQQRTALGATPRSILVMVLGEGFVLAAAGAALGLAMAYVAGRSLEALRASVTPTDGRPSPPRRRSRCS